MSGREEGRMGYALASSVPLRPLPLIDFLCRASAPVTVSWPGLRRLLFSEVKTNEQANGCFLNPAK